MKTLKGQFQIKDWQESVQQTVDDNQKRSFATVKQESSGDLQGNSELQYLLNYDSASSSDFVGFETIQANLDGNNGVLVLQHLGRFDAGVASSEFSIVFCCFDPTLIGAKGQFTSGENGTAEYIIRLN